MTRFLDLIPNDLLPLVNCLDTETPEADFLKRAKLHLTGSVGDTPEKL